MSDLRTPLKSARGLGSAHEGTGHWIAQRATAVALVFLVVWFMASMVANVGLGHEEMLAYLGQPLVSVLMIAFILAAFHHMRLGLQVVVEDYISSRGWRVVWLLAINFLAYGLGLAAVLSVLKIYFTS